MESLEVIPCQSRRDSLGRRLLDAKQRAALLDAFDVSGMTQAKFARSEGINSMTFSGWVQRRGASKDAHSVTTKPHHSLKSLKRMTAKKRPVTPAMTPTMKFREVVVSTEGSPATPVTVSELRVLIPGGIEVRGCDVAGAAALIKALREDR